MNLTDFDYIEQIVGDKRIRGGIATYTYTDSTFSVAAASTTPGGDIGVYGEAAALGSATGYVTSAYSLTNASTYANINVATANAMAGATSFGPSGYNASRSNATSLSTSHPYGHITTELAFSSSIGSI